MPKHLSAAFLALSFLVIDWLTFHDWRQLHSARDYLTLAASLLLFAYLGFDLFRGRRNSTPVPR